MSELVEAIGVTFASPNDASRRPEDCWWDPVILTEYSPFGNIGNFLDANRHLPVTQRLAFAADIGCGIRALHDAGLVWGDGKPGNVLVFAADRPAFHYLAKLGDFGDTRYPSAFWRAGEFPLGCARAGWTSPYSIYWTSLADRATISQEEHAAQCFHLDVFAYGLLVLWLIIGPDFQAELATASPTLLQSPLCGELGVYSRDPGHLKSGILFREPWL